VKRATRLLVAVLASALVVAGCGVGDGNPPKRQVVHGEGSGRLPDETLVDWVSYADAVVAATVLTEREVPMVPGALNAAGEGLQLRMLTMRVDTRVWSRSGGRAVPREFPLESGGWVIKSFTEKTPFTVGPVRLEVGSAYLIPLAWFPKGPFDAAEHFGLLGSETPALIGSDGRPTSAEPVTAPALRGFIGASLDDIASQLRSTAPDPRAAKYFSLDPVPRRNAVLKELGEPPIR
jgi:hypothetical protein